MKNKLVVYTVVIGGDYELPPTIPQDGVDYICFTDQPKLEHNGWIVIDVLPILPNDTFRSSRDMKIRPHRWLTNYSNSIYIDSTVHLHNAPLALWNVLIPDEATVFGGFFHSFRETIADEFMAVAKAKLDFKHIIDEQFLAYRKLNASILNAKPIWGGVLARRHKSPFCIDSMEVWFANILRYSRRDQLSLPLALTHLPRNHQNIIQADIHLTDFHKWPVSKKPKPPDYTVDETNNRIRKDARKLLKNIRKFARPLKRAAQFSSQWLVGLNIFGTTQNAPKGNKNTDFGYDEILKLYFAQDKSSGVKVFVSDRKRLELYNEGISHRQGWILSDYRLPKDLIREGDVVIDVGANIGELGLWVNDRGGRYIAFEPDPTAYQAMQNNITSEDLYEVALSDKAGTAEFYLSTSTADSSLFKPSSTDNVITVETALLDTFLNTLDVPKNIRLLKIEAEGMEPEVLSGAVKTIRNVEYVAVDAGPERGGDNTVPGVFNILTGAGFEVIDCFLLRGTFLFRKKDSNKS